MKLTKSQLTYDMLAPHFRETSSEKREYLESIDYLIQNLAKNKESVLDLGTGDGFRAVKIAKNIKASELTLVENSQAMISLCKKLNFKNKRVISSNIEDFTSDKKYENILCLWNVVGHLEPYSNIEKFFANVSKLLNENGLLFLDVNNKFNISIYGIWNVLKNIFKDIFQNAREYISFIKKIDDVDVPMTVHFFTKREILGLVKKSGLKVRKFNYVDYHSGEIKKYPWEGQLFFVISHDN